MFISPVTLKISIFRLYFSFANNSSVFVSHFYLFSRYFQVFLHLWIQNKHCVVSCTSWANSTALTLSYYKPKTVLIFLSMFSNLVFTNKLGNFNKLQHIFDHKLLIVLFFHFQTTSDLMLKITINLCSLGVTTEFSLSPISRYSISSW